MALIHDIQNLASNESSSMKDIISKAYLVARKLKLTKDSEWLKLELNGYPTTNDNNKLPDYRIFTGVLEAHNPYNGLWMPVLSDGNELIDKVSIWPFVGSIEEAESILANLIKNKTELVIRLNNNINYLLSQCMTVKFSTKFRLLLSHSHLINLLSKVRGNILIWSCELEDKGIIGDGMNFSLNEIKAAETMNTSVTYNITTGNNGPVQIQHESHKSDQNQHNNSMIDVERVSLLMAEIKEALPKIKFSNDSDSLEINKQLHIISEETNKPTPDMALVTKTLGFVREILTGAASSVFSTGIIYEITKLIS